MEDIQTHLNFSLLLLQPFAKLKKNYFYFSVMYTNLVKNKN